MVRPSYFLNPIFLPVLPKYTYQSLKSTRFTHLLTTHELDLDLTSMKKPNRHNPPRHHHLRLSTDEHRPPRRQNDPQGSRPHLPRHHQHPRFHDPLLHPSRQFAPGYPACRRPAQAQEQGTQGGGARWPGWWSWWWTRWSWQRSWTGPRSG